MFSSRRLSATTQPGVGSASSGRRAGGRMRAGRWSIVTRHLDHIHLISFIVAEPNMNWFDYEVTLSSSPDQVHSSSQGARVRGPGELHLPAPAGGVQVSLKLSRLVTGSNFVFQICYYEAVYGNRGGGSRYNESHKLCYDLSQFYSHVLLCLSSVFLCLINDLVEKIKWSGGALIAC